MSFTSTVKEEVTRLDTTRLEDISELSAIFRIQRRCQKVFQTNKKHLQYNSKYYS